ncbi:tripartite transporter small subunit [Moritella sp. F1]|nr:tripartite transporter small subunit [Moritella sp. F1]
MSNPEELQPRNRLDAGIIWAGNAISVLFLFTVLISFYEVLMRYVFNAPTIWVHETASFIGGTLFVLGGAYGLATDKHVRVVLIYDHVSERTKQYLNVFHPIMGLLFTVLLSFAAWTMTEGAWYAPWGEMRLETSGSAWDPAYPALLKALIFGTLCLMSVQFVLHLIQEIHGLVKKNK